jgi:hypothetical protein
MNSFDPILTHKKLTNESKKKTKNIFWRKAAKNSN